MTPTTTLYVDGACRGNPGPGGWGVYIKHSDGLDERYFGGEKHTTNNRMELMAAIEGLKHTNINLPAVIWTDSSYVQKGISEWIKGWKRKNWRKSDGGAVLNADLWQQLDQLCNNRKLTWNWIKGHAGHDGNEQADKLANQGVDAILSGKSMVEITLKESDLAVTPAIQSAVKSAAQPLPQTSNSQLNLF